MQEARVQPMSGQEYSESSGAGMQNSESVEALEERLGYHFGDRRVLLQSLTHTSYGHEHQQHEPIALRDNERLEFLGDAVLDVVVSDLLLENFPEAAEGQLSKMRAAVVNEKILAEVARSLHLDRHLRLGKGETQNRGATKPSILSSTFEALVAAIYLDGGFMAVYPVVRHLFSSLFEKGFHLLYNQDFKTLLQESVQSRWRITPTYKLVGTNGPEHSKCFEVEVCIDKLKFARSQGASKKEAEQRAARMALEILNHPTNVKKISHMEISVEFSVVSGSENNEGYDKR